MYKLVIEDDEGKTKLVPFIREEMTIGRKEGNTIRLTERNVSRQHARLVKTDSGTIELEDSSRYGTRLNGEKVKGGKAVFKEGDVVLIGDYRLSLRNESKGVVTPEKPPSQNINQGEAARLVVISSNFAGQEFPLLKPEIVIGRTEGDIRIDHRSISRNHAKIVREGDRYKILDLKSANGVKVNGESYRSIQLRKGDVIELGHVRMRFVPPGDDFVFIRTEAEPAAASPSGSSKLPLVGGLIALLLVVLGVVAFLAMGDGDPEGNNTPKTTAAKPSNTPEPPPTDTNKVDTKELLAKAQKAVDGLQWEEASNTLKDILKAEPSNADAEKMRSMVMREMPNAKRFEDAKGLLDAKKYQEALDKLDEIDEGSLYAKKVEDEKIDETARKAIAEESKGDIQKFIDNARVELRRGNLIRARRNILTALDIDNNNDEAQGLLRAINKKIKDKEGDKPNVAAKDPKDKANKPKKDPAPAGNPEDKRKKAKELLSEARTATASGNPGLAIAKAQEALKYGGGGAAYRVLAVAYEKKGDRANAVKYYNILLKGNCSSKMADIMRKKIVALGGSPGC